MPEVSDADIAARTAAAPNGGFTAILERLRRWYATGRGPFGAEA